MDSVLALCLREQLMLDESQVALLREWVAGHPATVDRDAAVEPAQAMPGSPQQAMDS